MARSPASVRLIAAALLAFGAAGCATAGASQAPTAAPSVVASTSAPTVARRGVDRGADRDRIRAHRDARPARGIARRTTRGDPGRRGR